MNETEEAAEKKMKEAIIRYFTGKSLDDLKKRLQIEQEEEVKIILKTFIEHFSVVSNIDDYRKFNSLEEYIKSEKDPQKRNILAICIRCKMGREVNKAIKRGGWEPGYLPEHPSYDFTDK